LKKQSPLTVLYVTPAQAAMLTQASWQAAREPACCEAATSLPEQSVPATQFAK